ncbi:MAG: hypothetical protein ACFB5Z_14890 [Elainellaceae cyanobacterium]
MGFVAAMLLCCVAIARPAIAADPSSLAAPQTSLQVDLEVGKPDPNAALADAESPPEGLPASSAPAALESDRPQAKTYFLPVMAGSSRRQITLKPPATKLVVTFESGDAAIRCGISSKGSPRLQAYSCALGKPLTIERDPDSAITRFWAENLSTVTDVRLRLESYSD